MPAQRAAHACSLSNSAKQCSVLSCVQVSDALLSLLLADEREALKITSTGLKLFERQEMKGKQTSSCMYRIAQVRWLGCGVAASGTAQVQPVLCLAELFRALLLYQLEQASHGRPCSGYILRCSMGWSPGLCRLCALASLPHLMFCLQEGLPFLLPHLTKQLVRMGIDDFLRLLVEKNLPLQVTCNGAAAANGDEVPEGQEQQKKKPASGQAMLDTPEVLQQLESVALGGAVAVLEESVAAQLGLATEEASGALTVNAPLAIAVWRTPASLSVLVSKTECEQLADKVKKALERSKQQQDKQQQQEPAAEPMVVG